MAEAKPKLKYRVVTGKKPGTSEVLMRPQITERETYYVDQVISYAINSGYIRGQFNDLKGTVNGFIEACKSLAESGKAVNLANWMRIHAELTGALSEDRELTEANELHVNITALTDLKQSVDSFTWENVDDPTVRAKIEYLASKGGTKSVIEKNKEIVCTGKNLYYNASYGDKVTVTHALLTTPIAIVPTSSDYAHMEFAFPSALADLDDGTVLTFTFTLHAGIEGSVEQVITKTAVFAAE